MIGHHIFNPSPVFHLLICIRLADCTGNLWEHTHLYQNRTSFSLSVHKEKCYCELTPLHLTGKKKALRNLAPKCKWVNENPPRNITVLDWDFWACPQECSQLPLTCQLPSGALTSQPQKVYTVFPALSCPGERTLNECLFFQFTFLLLPLLSVTYLVKSTL